MSITPRGMSIQEAYRLYCDDKFIVNRKYQRKLVWNLNEKRALIDSIRKDYPIPLILLAEEVNQSSFEIMDGMQRLNAIFSFIENKFDDMEGKFFDVTEFSRAKQASEVGKFVITSKKEALISPSECANILDYQLAITVFPASNEQQVTDVFGRINSGGRQLSWQEKRQAGMVDSFSNLVRKLASEIRGDASREKLPLSEMPEISIDSARSELGYQLLAEEIFWCKQGILWVKQLRDSEDEEIITDILASLVTGQPIARSRQLLDDIYDSSLTIYNHVRSALATYGEDRVYEEIKATLSVLLEVIDAVDSSTNALRKFINPGSSNPIKSAFYSLFMAMHDLIIVQELSPCDPYGLMNSLSGLQKEMKTTANYAKVEDRIRNVDKTKGLIQKFFVKKDPPLLGHGSGLALDLENALRRSKIETSRYECKQGLVDLSDKRVINGDLPQKILETICGIANVGPDADGFLFIGVADTESDVKRIQSLDGINPISISSRYVVGIDRELSLLKCDLETYVAKVLAFIKKSDLTEPLKSCILSQIDLVDYKGLSVMRIRIPAQSKVSFLGEEAFIREGSSTVEAKGKKLLAINSIFT